MAAFEVIVHEARIEPHPNADRIEICRIGDYQSVVAKGQFSNGDLVAYIPESSILPQSLIEEMEMTGKLGGKEANRISPVRFRGVVSQGIVYPLPNARPGDDVTEQLGVTKYTPPIPDYMQGQVYHAEGNTVHYDVENFKKYPELLQEGEEVVMTEKLHGSQCQMGYHHGEPIITSKLYGAHGQVLYNNDENAGNIYVQAFNKHADALRGLAQAMLQHPEGPPGHLLPRRRGLWPRSSGPRVRHQGEDLPRIRRIRRPAPQGQVPQLRRDDGTPRRQVRDRPARIPGPVQQGNSHGAHPGTLPHCIPPTGGGRGQTRRRPGGNEARPRHPEISVRPAPVQKGEGHRVRVTTPDKTCLKSNRRRSQ